MKLTEDLRPLKREHVQLQIFEQMKNQILKGVWKPGTKIPSENELAKILGVSRISIREALQKLAALDLIKTKHGEGTYVKELTAGLCVNSLIPELLLGKNDLVDVLEFRRLIETGIVALVVDRVDENGIAELNNLLQKMKNHSSDTEKFAKYDLEFHLALARMTRNPVIIKVHTVIRDILSVSMEDIVKSLGTNLGIHYHTRLFEAIKDREKEKAQQLMEEHIETTINAIIDAV